MVPPKRANHYYTATKTSQRFVTCGVLRGPCAGFQRATKPSSSAGIIALIDEVTGYQEIRDREALQQILDKYLRKEYAAWAKRFPDDFYREMFRLRGWQWRGMKVNRPSVVGRYTKDLVYSRLAPGIPEELERHNPKDDKGNRKSKHHQWLTEDIGHPALAQHL
jgi:hypothetical protein